jgi:hypothetical protein
MPPIRKSPVKAKKPMRPEQDEVEVPVVVPPPISYTSLITNPLFHKIMLKTLSHALAKNMDWHQMSLVIAEEMQSAADDQEHRIIIVKKGRKGKGREGEKEKEKEGELEQGEEERGKGRKAGELSGTELRQSVCGGIQEPALTPFRYRRSFSPRLYLLPSLCRH